MTGTEEISEGLTSAPLKVSARQITKRFGAFVANKSIDLDIKSGEFLTLLGPSGCGKTTLMRVIAGLEQCDEGSVVIDGRDVTKDPPRKRGLGMVFQNYSLFPHMSVWENVAYGLRVQGMSAAAIAERVDQMLNLIRLPHIAKRRPAELSGGQQQRVALARALATKPSLLMLDEPLGALDLKLRHQLQTELRRIHRETGVTFLFVTHDQGEALFLSDRIAVMRDGRIEQIDTPERIYQNPVSSYVADFIGDVTLLRCKKDAKNSTRALIYGTDAIVPLAQPTPFDDLQLVARPENVSIAPTGSHHITTRVEEIINEGSTTLLLLAVGEDCSIKARLIGRPPTGLTIGASLNVTIDPNVTILPLSAQ